MQANFVLIILILNYWRDGRGWMHYDQNCGIGVGKGG